MCNNQSIKLYATVVQCLTARVATCLLPGLCSKYQTVLSHRKMGTVIEWQCTRNQSINQSINRSLIHSSRQTSTQPRCLQQLQQQHDPQTYGNMVGDSPLRRRISSEFNRPSSAVNLSRNITFAANVFKIFQWKISLLG